MYKRTFIATVVITIVILLLEMCTIRIDTNKVTSFSGSHDQIETDNQPPEVIIISPQNDQVISRTFLIQGKTQDESEFFTHLLIRDSVIRVFSNQVYWEYQLKTWYYQNGELSIKVFATDKLGNSSPTQEIKTIVSNDLIITYENLNISTNNNFTASINFLTTNYFSLKLLINNSLIIETNAVTNILIPVSTNSFTQGVTNYIYMIVDDEITNIYFFVIDLEPPILSINLQSNQYVYSDFEISFSLADSSVSKVFFIIEGQTNYISTYPFNSNYTFSINTFNFQNGPKTLEIFSLDEAGNKSETLLIPVLIANFYVSSVIENNTTRKYYFNLVYHVEDLLFWTTENFNRIMIYRPSYSGGSISAYYNYSINIDDIQSCVINPKIYLGIVDKNNSVFRILTNKTDTNFNVQNTISGVLDFSIPRDSDGKILIYDTNSLLRIYDIVTRSTVTNYNISEKVYDIFSLDKLGNLYTFLITTNSIYTAKIIKIDSNDSLIEITNNIIISSSEFVTKTPVSMVNLNEKIYAFFISEFTGYDQLDLLIIYRDDIVTNIQIHTTTNRILGINAFSYTNSTFITWVESKSNMMYLYLCEIEDYQIKRIQKVFSKDIGFAVEGDSMTEELISKVYVKKEHNTIFVFCPVVEYSGYSYILKLEGM